MKRYRFLTALLAAAVLCTAAGCGDAASSQAGSEHSTSDVMQSSTETADSQPENGTDSTESTADDSSNPDESGNPDESSHADESSRTDESSQSAPSGTAEAAVNDIVKRFMEACKANDHETVSALTNTAVAASVLTGAEPENPLDSVTDFEVRDYTIGKAVRAESAFSAYQEYRGEVLASYDKLTDADSETKEMLDRYLKLMPEAEDLWRTTVQVNSTNGGSSEDMLFVMKTGGEWIIDLACVPAMNGYMRKSQISKINQTAKTVYKAANSALAELDTADVDLSQLRDSTLTFTGADFEGCKKVDKPQTKAEILDAFKYYVLQYASEITGLEEIAFRVAETDCAAAAVKNGIFTDYRTDTEYTAFGTYPHMLTTDDFGTLNTIGQALDYAAN